MLLCVIGLGNVRRDVRYIHQRAEAEVSRTPNIC